MLQIASGKLFTREPGRRNELRGVLYGNLRIGRQPIVTAAGTLLPTDNLRESNTLVYEFVELIEAEKAGPGVLVSHGVDPYLTDFSAVVSFALGVVCTPDATLAARLMQQRRGVGVPNSPGKYIRRVYDSQIFAQPRDEKHLIWLVKQLLALERQSFLAAMRAIRTYVTGLHRVADDLELAYTLMVASLESLAQEFDGHRATWTDYDETKKKLIDNALRGAEEGTKSKVRGALLQIEHVSLGRRFREFTLAHVQPSFFREESTVQDGSIGRSELPSALRHAYMLRSRYIHNLQPLPDPLTMGAYVHEVVRDGGQPMLTLQGISHVAHHVITDFIRTQPTVEREVYNYRLERAGVVQVRMAPQYWVGNATGMLPGGGRQKLEGFLEQIAAWWMKEPGNSITDLRPVLLRALEMRPQMNAMQRRPFSALYIMFNQLVSKAERMPDFEKMGPELEKDISGPSIEGMVAHLVLDIAPEWKLPQHDAVHEKYFATRDRKNGLVAPRLVEAGLSLALAERYRSAGNAQRAKELITFAVENQPGRTSLLELETSFDIDTAISWREILLPTNPLIPQTGLG
jgi:hypothetical protein